MQVSIYTVIIYRRKDEEAIRTLPDPDDTDPANYIRSWTSRLVNTAEREISPEDLRILDILLNHLVRLKRR